MGILDSFVTIVDDDDKKGQDKQDGQEPKKKKLMYRSPARDFLGQELYGLDCRGSNLYVHENAVVIDRTRGGLWNAGDNNFKVIPFKSIVAIQAKLDTSILTGYIEFETANSPLSTGRGDKAERNSENSVILSGKKERYEEAKELLKYVFSHICDK